MIKLLGRQYVLPEAPEVYNSPYQHILVALDWPLRSSHRDSRSRTPWLTYHAHITNGQVKNIDHLIT